MMRCTRCGTVWGDGASPFCRDDHDHSFKPADHWLNRKWDDVVDGGRHPERDGSRPSLAAPVQSAASRGLSPASGHGPASAPLRAEGQIEEGSCSSVSFGSVKERGTG